MEANEYTLRSLFADGGFMMYPLVLCSLVALGVILAKAYTLWAAHTSSRNLLSEVEQLASQQRFEEAVRRAEETPGPVAAILVSGIGRVIQKRASGDEVETAVKTTGRIELGFLERGLALLATIANVAPLLGFLGTVIGMIGAFAAIEGAGQVEASLVAGGIKIALITTATGLVIAIPVSVAYNFFVTRIDMLIVDMEQGTGAVLNMLWGLQAAGGAGLAGGPAVRPSAMRSGPAATLRDTTPRESGIKEEGHGGSDPRRSGE